MSGTTRTTVKIDTGKLALFLDADGTTTRYMHDRAEAIEQRARGIVHVDTGDLKRSHKTERRRSTSGRLIQGWTVTADRPYAGYEHDGPNHGDGFPWLRIAMEDVMRRG